MNSTELLEKIQTLREKKAAMETMLDDQISSYAAMLDAQLTAEGLTKQTCETAIAFYTHPKDIKVTDWTGLLGFVQAKGAYDILQKRIAPGAVQVRLDAGEDIPGIKVGEPKKTLVIKSLKEVKDEA